MRKLTADWIFPVSSAPIKDGILVVDDSGRIADVINPEHTNYKIADTEYFPGIICPGFVNTHCHLELSYFKGKIPEKIGLNAFLIFLDEIRKQTQTEFREEAMYLAEKEMLNNGIVAVGDISNTLDTLELKQIKKLFYHTFVEVFGSDPQQARFRFGYAKEIFDFYHSNGLSAVSIVPHSPYSVSNQLFELIKQHAIANNSHLSMHHQESEDENLLFMNKTGNVLERMKNYGVDFSAFQPTGKRPLESVAPFLLKNNPMLLVHNTVSQEKDMIFASEHFKNLWLALCPNANLYIENRLPNISLFNKMGLQLTIGTDSLASNRHLSVLEEMKTISQHFPEIKLQEILSWATLNGAKFLQADKFLGSFEKGKIPGAILIKEMDSEHLLLTKASKAQRIC